MSNLTVDSSSNFFNENEMRVTKRNGDIEIVSFDKILKRIKNIASEKEIKLNYTSLAMKVIDQLYDKISTTKIDELSAEQCASMASIHPDYNILAGRIAVSSHHKNTPSKFSEAMEMLYNYVDKHNKQSPLILQDLYDIVQKYKDELDNLCDYERDYLIDYFGFKTLERAYLMKINKNIVERPQHMWLRVSIGIHGDDMPHIIETYNLMSQKYFTHATPTLFNSGTPHPQLSSCYLQAMESDSIEGIYNTLKDCALISKWAGGIGLHIHNIRASGSHIRGTNGTSNGIVPMLKVFNHTAKYVDQCLDPNTIVYTKRGPTKIKNIIVGDKVIADDGTFYKIGKVLDNDYFGDLYTLEVENTLQSLKLTDMHPLWTIPGNKCMNDVIEMLDRKMVEPEFIEVKNIDVNDYIGFPIPTYEKDIYQYTEDDCRMYGILLAKGVINNYKNNTVNITLHADMDRISINFIEDYLSKINIKITYMYKNNFIKLEWERNSMFKFTYEMLYDNENETINSITYKKCISSILHLPKPKILQFIKGLIEMVGIFKEDHISIENNVIYQKYDILEYVRYMLLRFGILTSGNVTMLNIPYHKVLCDLFKNNNIEPKELTFFEYNNYLFTKVKNNSKIENYSGRVIDIEVDNDDHHNFLTNNGLVKNGGGKRNGSFAIYLEPWHADIELFLQMRKNHGDEELKARDLFYAIWMPDLFMERVKSGSNWTLMCPDECPGLSDVYGDEFEKLYTKYENEGRGRKTMEARDLWFQILAAQMETGTPYILYKDACNKKSNQKNIGVIKSSNLCCEVTLYSDKNETAVCNLASIALPMFIDTVDGISKFNYSKLHDVTRVVTYNLNKVIDVNYYPTEKTKRSNMRHRPIGIGVQGLADVFMMLNIPFTCDEAKDINKKIFETIYHAALEESCHLATKYGYYETFPGSPASQGILQFDMWGINTHSGMYDWDELKDRICKHGLRNSTLLAPMPTASTSQILGFNECIEPITSNIYSRRTLAGEFIMANKYLMNDLIKLDLWNEKVKNNIIANNGSIQQISIIPQEIRDKYKTVWEIQMKDLIDMSADRGIYICQSQSLNLWMEDPKNGPLTSMHFYSWSKGLKTGIYYLRRRGCHQAQQFTIEPEKKEGESLYEEDDICEMCSS